MSVKLLVVGIFIGLAIGFPAGYFALPLVLNSSSPNSEYIELRVEKDVSGSDTAVRKFGGYNYFFMYTPDFSGFEGYLVIQRENTPAGSYTLRTDITQRYQDIEFKITEIQSDYCVLMARYLP